MKKIPKLKWHVPPSLIHVLVWLFVYMVPIVLMIPNSDDVWKFRYRTTAPFLGVVACFYANYFFLIPKYFNSRRFCLYTASNIFLFLIITFVISIWRNHIVELGIMPPPRSEIPIVSVLKGIAGLMFVVGVAVSIHSTSMWFHSKDTMQKLELEHIHSELSFLKSQISPHFLFNTLNNILTLIDENTELAKQSVLELSKLLRTMLYELEADKITIEREVEFLHNYSSLMRLRYGPNLDFKLETDLENPETPIAPLLFIPLVENAFKHGIGPLIEENSINVKISSKKGKIIYESTNTYFPKTNQDKSGSGIGIANMKKRLNLLYENNFLYDCKVTGSDYIIKLEINVDSPN